VSLERFPTAEALADAVANHVVEEARSAIARSGRFTLCLSGGATPRPAYQRLAQLDYARRVEWNRVHVVWGDERCVPPDHPRSNYGMAYEALLRHVPVPREQIHRIRGEDDPQVAAAAYERELRELLGDQRLDLALMGLGADGHTASLFPGRPAVNELERWVMAVPSPNDAEWRVTLTPVVINAAAAVTFVVSEAAKAERLNEVLEGAYAPDRLPAQMIRPVNGRLRWMVTEAAFDDR
jgi:6-phosphogluconolactonase